MRRNAFTLVELLVVVAIIALLVSILVPTLSEAQRLAKIVKCQSHLKQLCNALEDASWRPGDTGKTTYQRYPDPAKWPVIPYSTEPTDAIYFCPEDTSSNWGNSVMGLVYQSGMAPNPNIPWANGKSCKVRRGTDSEGPYTEFVFEENPSYPVEFWDETSRYPGTPDYSDNDGRFRVYDRKEGARKVKLMYYTCSYTNKIYYFGELIWYPLKNYVGKEMYINDMYTSYGMNSTVGRVEVAPDTIVLLDYPEQIALYSDVATDKTQMATYLDEASRRHRGRINVLYADNSVRSVGPTSLNPTINPDPWTP
jgi:prepilin-type N-terminal cleavage/methylation domain-containing protein/prepilin-type processing-associated H-X9-DG protein